MRAALAYMNTNYCVNQARVFSVGFSYGGIMSHTIACQMSDTFRAVAPMAGAIFGRPTCKTHPIAAWMTHGTMDTSASGGVDFTAGQSARDRIVTLNHCTTTPPPVDASPCVAYQGCDGGYRSSGASTTAPTSSPASPPPPSRTSSCSSERSSPRTSGSG